MDGRLQKQQHQLQHVVVGKPEGGGAGEEAGCDGDGGGVPGEEPRAEIWFFSALTFHQQPGDPRSLLLLLFAFTASTPTAVKPLALLAPVVSELSVPFSQQ